MPQNHERSCGNEDEIRTSCPICAQARKPTTIRNAEGRMMWIHHETESTPAGCKAAALHPLLSIQRRRESTGFAT